MQKKYDEAISVFDSIFSSDVNDKEPGANIMENYRNYRHHACIQIAACYEAKNDYNKALDYMLLARDKYKYLAHCGTCAIESGEHLKGQIERLEKEVSKQTKT